MTKPEEMSEKEKLEKAKLPGILAMKYHPYYQGKIEIVPKCKVDSIDDFAIWYTPGVAEPCKAIQANKELSYVHTSRWNTIAVVSDGTRVLGLGNIGPEAGMPVMEGKSLIFKYLGGVDAVPLCLDARDPDKFIETVKILQPSFGGFNLEDIEQPKCFYVLDRLRKEAEVPVWHDDQQGTAAVIFAGLINALKYVGKKMSEAKVTLVGAGASNICAARIMMKGGVTPGNIIMVDSKGTIHMGRKDLDPQKWKEKIEMAQKTNKEGLVGGIPEALKGADVCISASKPGPGIIKKEWIKGMADKAVVFACANPVPEIWPWEAKEAGAKVVATGRSDFENQVNNSLGFPGIFRGTLDVRAKTITDEMCIAAATELAKVAEDRGLRPEMIIPTMDDWEVFPREAAAVGMKAIEQGVARLKLSRQELYDTAQRIIKRSRELTQSLMKNGFIPPAPK